MNEASGSSCIAEVGGVNIDLTGCSRVAGLNGPNALQFNGTSSDHAQTHSALDHTGTNKLTVECLIKWGTFTTTAGILYESSANFGSNQGTVFLDPDGGTSAADAHMMAGNNGNVGVNRSDYSRFTANVWHHLVVVHDFSLGSNENTVYVDGVVQTRGTTLNNNNTGNFGNYVWYFSSRAGTSFFAGVKTLQHFAIYPTALTAARIAQHAQAALRGW